ncbi:MAG: glycoside hydrolase family 16 protein [Verrucomicrobia bacterium]|nr:glycoside hydrolase family 16 protein [Verrucomicrobiota bacterium]
MNHRFQFLARATCLFLMGGTLLPSGSVQAQNLIWCEEFNSGSAPDSSVWSYELGNGCPNLCGWGNSELQSYTSNPANVRVEGGNLIITALRNGNTFTSARIKTQNKLTFQYGTIEARIKVPDLNKGLWPAFWTLGNNWNNPTPWPNCGEIDIMEMGHSSAIAAGVVNRRVGSATHWYNNGYMVSSASLTAPLDLNGSFHTNRMEWTPAWIKFYLDNTPIFAFNIANPADNREEFHLPHFFILNLAVGGYYTGITTAAGITAPFPAEYVIDYIRIFDNGYTVLGGSSLALRLPVALNATLVGTNIQISFPTVNGACYNIVCKDTITDPKWTFVETVSGDGEIKTVSYDTTVKPGRLYAVQTLR